jgi:hypothetical protein
MHCAERPDADILHCASVLYSRPQPPKTLAELREMLAEAVRNTQPETKRQSTSKRDRG